MSTKNKRQLRRSAPLRRRIGNKPIDTSEDMEEDGTFGHVAGVKASVGDNDGWQTAEDFNNNYGVPLRKKHSKMVDEGDNEASGDGSNDEGAPQRKKRRKQGRNNHNA